MLSPNNSDCLKQMRLMFKLRFQKIRPVKKLRQISCSL